MHTYIPADHAPAVPGEISGIKGSAQIESGCLMDGGLQVGHSLVEWCGAVELSSDSYKSSTSMQLCPVQSSYLPEVPSLYEYVETKKNNCSQLSG